MILPHNDKKSEPTDPVVPKPLGSTEPPFSLTTNTAIPALPQQFLHSKFITHNPKAGLNPLVDAAAYLFSIIGKLKKLKSYRNISKLQQELITEINTFQEAIKGHGYTAEYILVSRYALCATLDDIIINTAWGSQGKWDAYNLLLFFNQEKGHEERFFLILERIIKDPPLYIDVMELMYICLSLGYKGNLNATDFSTTQLEKLTHSLYKRIRAYRGDYNKILSPYPLRLSEQKRGIQKPRLTYGIPLAITLMCIALLFIALGFILDTISNQAYQELIHIGKFILYETPSN